MAVRTAQVVEDAHELFEFIAISFHTSCEKRCYVGIAWEYRCRNAVKRPVQIGALQIVLAKIDVI